MSRPEVIALSEFSVQVRDPLFPGHAFGHGRVPVHLAVPLGDEAAFSVAVELEVAVPIHGAPR